MKTHYAGPVKPFDIHMARVDAFGDTISFRDPRGLSLRPSLLPRRGAAGLVLEARGGFVIRHEYWITQQSGRRFVDATEDDNDIHRTGNIVAGAMTSSKLLIPFEILMPALRIVDMKIKFTDKAVYGERTLNIYAVRFCREDTLEIDVHTYQSQRMAAKARLAAEVGGAEEPIVHVKKRKVNSEQYARVCEFLASLNVDSEAYFDRKPFRNYTYPLSFLASLPSGAIVRGLGGGGGMLNSLRLEFRDMPRIPIVGKEGPTVKIEQPRQRKTFNRIFTEIVNDLITHCRGSAIVNPVASFVS